MATALRNARLSTCASSAMYRARGNRVPRAGSRSATAAESKRLRLACGCRAASILSVRTASPASSRCHSRMVPLSRRRPESAAQPAREAIRRGCAVPWMQFVRCHPQLPPLVRSCRLPPRRLSLLPDCYPHRRGQHGASFRGTPRQTAAKQPTAHDGDVRPRHR